MDPLMPFCLAPLGTLVSMELGPCIKLLGAPRGWVVYVRNIDTRLVLLLTAITSVGCGYQQRSSAVS